MAGSNVERTRKTSRGVTMWLWKQASFLVFLAVVLFLSAGRLDWTMGWVQLGLYVAAVAAQAAILIRRSPELLAERSGYQSGTKRWDLVITSLAAAVLPIATWIVAGLGVRFPWRGRVSSTLEISGTLAWVLGYALTIWAMASNPFFSATVRIQGERGHAVATGGPYQYVRHPGYVGAIVFQLATPVMLGSMWALIPSALAAMLYIVRTGLEDTTLKEELPGYRAYAGRVVYRLLPGVW